MLLISCQAPARSASHAVNNSVHMYISMSINCRFSAGDFDFEDMSVGELPSVDDLEVAAAAAAAAMEALEEQARGIAADAAHSSSEVRIILVVCLTFWSASEEPPMYASGLAMEALKEPNRKLQQLIDPFCSRMLDHCPGCLWHDGLMCQAAARLHLKSWPTFEGKPDTMGLLCLLTCWRVPVLLSMLLCKVGALTEQKQRAPNSSSLLQLLSNTACCLCNCRRTAAMTWKRNLRMRTPLQTTVTGTR